MHAVNADILPLRPGHTLVVPKMHCARVSELPEEHAAALGAAVSKIANALTKGECAPSARMIPATDSRGRRLASQPSTIQA